MPPLLARTPLVMIERSVLAALSCLAAQLRMVEGIHIDAVAHFTQFVLESEQTRRRSNTACLLQLTQLFNVPRCIPAACSTGTGASAFFGTGLATAVCFSTGRGLPSFSLPAWEWLDRLRQRLLIHDNVCQLLRHLPDRFARHIVYRQQRHHDSEYAKHHQHASSTPQRSSWLYSRATGVQALASYATPTNPSHPPPGWPRHRSLAVDGQGDVAVARLRTRRHDALEQLVRYGLVTHEMT